MVSNHHLDPQKACYAANIPSIRSQHQIPTKMLKKVNQVGSSAAVVPRVFLGSLRGGFLQFASEFDRFHGRCNDPGVPIRCVWLQYGPINFNGADWNGFFSGCSSSSEAPAGSYLRAQKATITKKIQRMKITEMPWGGGSLPFLFRWNRDGITITMGHREILGSFGFLQGSRQIQAINGALAMERHCWTGSLKKVRESSTTKTPCQFGSQSGHRFSPQSHQGLRAPAHTSGRRS